ALPRDAEPGTVHRRSWLRLQSDGPADLAWSGAAARLRARYHQRANHDQGRPVRLRNSVLLFPRRGRPHQSYKFLGNQIERQADVLSESLPDAILRHADGWHSAARQVHGSQWLPARDRLHRRLVVPAVPLASRASALHGELSGGSQCHAILKIFLTPKTWTRTSSGASCARRSGRIDRSIPWTSLSMSDTERSYSSAASGPIRRSGSPNVWSATG